MHTFHSNRFDMTMIYDTFFIQARRASLSLAQMYAGQIDAILLHLADMILDNAEDILAANRYDLSAMDADDPRYDRLRLDRSRLETIASDVRNVAALPSPLGMELDRRVCRNGMEIRKVSVPFGVIGVIYEARPNVGVDVFTLCLKSGNSCILKGGSDAAASNAAIVSLIKQVLRECDADEDIVSLLPPSRESAVALMNATGKVDLLIPRGGRGLIDYVRDNARVPVIETGAGICHTYFDKAGDLLKGRDIICNAKTRRVSVCNALDCLVIHRDRLADLHILCEGLASHNVIIYADEPAYAALDGHYPSYLLRRADESSFGTEYLSYMMSVKTVDDIYGALEHIGRYSSKHSEAIVSEDNGAIALFQKMVDAACVYANVSTAFTDGAQFGLGAEIGISTQKLHARGPMSLRELTTYKYLITGSGQIREP